MELKFIDGVRRTFFFLLAFSMTRRETVAWMILDLIVRAHCDPWVSVTVNRDRRSLRRRPPSPITQFRTKVSVIIGIFAWK